jgi:hypothetical protein
MIKSRNLLPLQHGSWQDIGKIYLRRFIFAASFYALAFFLAGIILTIKTFEKHSHLHGYSVTTVVLAGFFLVMIAALTAIKFLSSKDEQNSHNFTKKPHNLLPFWGMLRSREFLLIFAGLATMLLIQMARQGSDSVVAKILNSSNKNESIVIAVQSAGFALLSSLWLKLFYSFRDTASEEEKD